MLSPGQDEAPREAWAVAFGNSYNDAERCLACGYENGGARWHRSRRMLRC